MSDFKKKIILGVDPGLITVGFSVLSLNNQEKPILLDFGSLSPQKKAALPTKLKQINEFFKKKIDQWGVTELALEKPFLGKNAQNFLKLGYVCGILILLANQYKLKISEFPPRKVKLALTGHGGACKTQISNLIKLIFPIEHKIDKKDTTDAIAISLCCLWSSQKNSSAELEKATGETIKASKKLC